MVSPSAKFTRPAIITRLVEAQVGRHHGGSGYGTLAALDGRHAAVGGGDKGAPRRTISLDMHEAGSRRWSPVTMLVPFRQVQHHELGLRIGGKRIFWWCRKPSPGPCLPEEATFRPHPRSPRSRPRILSLSITAPRWSARAWCKGFTAGGRHGVEGCRAPDTVGHHLML